MSTPLPPSSGALPGGRGVEPTVATTIGSDSRSTQAVGMGATGADVKPPEASGRQQINALPAQGSVAQGPARSSLDSHTIIPGVVADHPKPEQSGIPSKNDKGVGFYG